MKKQITALVILLGPITFASTGVLASNAAKKPAAVVAATKAKPPLGNISKFRTIVADTLVFTKAGDLKKAEKRITDMETKWDAYANPLQAKNKADWTILDGELDTVLKVLRAPKPDASATSKALESLLKQIDAFS